VCHSIDCHSETPAGRNHVDCCDTLTLAGVSLQGALQYARRRGWRVNLRPLAERRTLAFALGLYIGLRWIAWPLLRFLWLVATIPLEDDFTGGDQRHQYGGVSHGSHSEGYREF
jgi:hypothetical protein